MRVLVVDDSERVRKFLASGLHAQGLAAETASDGAEALRVIDSQPIDVVVLDLMMPGMDGIQLLKALKGRSEKPRILVLSARDQVEDRVEALNLGADDYLVKPFAFDEVVARINALSRRRADAASPLLQHGRLQLDTGSRVVRVDDAVLQLTPKEYALLELLLRCKGRLLSPPGDLRALVRKRQLRIGHRHRGPAEHDARQARSRRRAGPDPDAAGLRLCH